MSANSIFASVQPLAADSSNALRSTDRAAHDWYRFVLAFPPHLVRRYIAEFNLGENDTLLDPFCGTGTTLVEGKKQGIRTVGLEPNPIARFASEVKTDWSTDGTALQLHALEIAGRVQTRLLERRGRRRTLQEDQLSLLLADSISPVPLHKTIILLEHIRAAVNPLFTKYELLALARALTTSIGNLHFGPEVGVGKPKQDVDVVVCWVTEVERICDDLKELRKLPSQSSEVFCHDARKVNSVLAPGSISAVITSPPYPNEKDYTRATRLESVLLGFMKNREDLRGLKHELMRSNTKNVYKGDSDHDWIEDHADIQQLAMTLETKRVELNKTSGFERLYPTVMKLYFGGMAKHLSNLRECLSPGAKLAYVVGDQASYFQVLVRTGQFLEEIAASLGYSVVRRDLFRLRHSSATGAKLREEVVVLQWKGTG